MLPSLLLLLLLFLMPMRTFRAPDQIRIDLLFAS
jgi:hypothetical protein